MNAYRNLYKVGIGLIQKNGDVVSNWSAKNVIADDALQAIKKSRLRKGKQFAEEVTLIASVDSL